MKIIDKYHRAFIYEKRIKVLANHLADLIPQNSKILDVGSGDGKLASILKQLRRDISVLGVDVLQREKSFIEVLIYDGHTLPFRNNEFNIVLFVDVLHHTDNQMELLTEARRVASESILIKDHICNSWIDNKTLRFMDNVGNKRFGVNLVFDFWNHEKWLNVFDKLGLTIIKWKSNLHIYTFPLSLIFDRQLHFIAHLKCDVKKS